MRSWFSNLSIKSKLLLLSIAASTFVLSAFSLGLYAYEKSFFFKDREASAVRLAEITSRNLIAAIAFGDMKAINEFLEIVSSDSDFSGALISNEKNQNIFQTQNLKNDISQLRGQIFEALDKQTRISRDKEKFLLETSLSIDNRHVGTITMLFSYATAKSKLENFAVALSLSLAFALLLGSLVSIRLQGVITKRLSEILSMIQEISFSRDYSLAIADMGSDEIGVLGKNFNLMLSEINQKDLSLRLANLSLESRVQERTHALEIAVNNLQDAQQQIFDKHKQLLNVISNAPIAMAMFDEAKNIIVYSQRWRVLFGVSENNDLDKRLSLYLPDSWDDAFQMALDGAANSANEDYFKDSTGTAIFIKWTAQPWHNQDDNIGGVIISAEDISDLVKARDAAIKVAKTRTEFMANVSHELRTPLNGIIGFASLLQDSYQDPDQKEHVDLIRSSGEILLRTINDVLDFSKLERGNSDLEKISFSPAKFISDLEKLFFSIASNKQNVIECQIDPLIPERVLGDEFRLKQILTNLIGNANKFTQNGKLILKLQVTEKNNTVCKIKFEVQDTGIGIPADKISEIFKPFSQADGSVTRKFGGTGLGLSIASSLVSLMGGKLRAESLLGSGSSFYFEVNLPIDVNFKVKDAEKISLAVPANVLSGKRILVAEDNQINMKLIRKILEKSGCQILAVENGQMAVDTFNNQSLDLVILDMQMPIMGGLEACKLIRNNLQQGGDQIPIVALTAHAFDEDRQKCIEAGMNTFLTKPIDKHQLISALTELVS